VIVISAPLSIVHLFDVLAIPIFVLSKELLVLFNLKCDAKSIKRLFRKKYIGKIPNIMISLHCYIHSCVITRISLFQKSSGDPSNKSARSLSFKVIDGTPATPATTSVQAVSIV